MMKSPTIFEKVPRHLHQYIARQDVNLYTPIDHAAWRYILKVSKTFFAQKAHQKYLTGLIETGITEDHIPTIAAMDEKLSQFGWRAVSIVGFIPPAVFMEFLSLGVLPIACDMRCLEHIAYTPAPDIVHEAAGHAPIIADPEYADYLLQYGEIAKKVIFSDQDMNVYQAIRDLSDLKEDRQASAAALKKAEQHLEQTLKKVDYVSEATQLARMSWWTIEYGLVGTMEDPKIYGAGLLSSVAESYHCLSSKVKKIPFSIDCINYGYDITKPQPQLFVTPDFKKLQIVLDELAATMAYKRGGVEGLVKAQKAKTLTSVELDSGVQISGVLTDYLLNPQGQVDFIRFSGPSQLAEKDHELEDQGIERHPQGFSSPLGILKNSQGKTAADLTSAELKKFKNRLEFESGFVVSGELVGVIEGVNGKNLVLTFDRCKVTRGSEIFYKPEWGPYDLVAGANIVSVFGGPADRVKYLSQTGSYPLKPPEPRTNLNQTNAELNKLYLEVRKLRESLSHGGRDRLGSLDRILTELKKNYSHDWLLRLEILEILAADQQLQSRAQQLKNELLEQANQQPKVRELILRGLALC